MLQVGFHACLQPYVRCYHHVWVVISSHTRLMFRYTWVYGAHPDFAGMAGQARYWFCCWDGQTALGELETGYRVNSCARRILLKYDLGMCCLHPSDVSFPPSLALTRRKFALKNRLWCSSVSHLLWLKVGL
jgi:hypothetical protein